MNIKYLKSPGCQPGSLLSSEENKIKKAAETAFLKPNLCEQAVSRVLSADCSAVWPSILAHRCRCAHAITESLTGSHFCGKTASALIPILHRVGFTWRTSRQAAGELLPRLSILTAQVRRYISVALSLESPPPDVIRHPALWSSDFPHADKPARSHLAYSLKTNYCCV